MGGPVAESRVWLVAGWRSVPGRVNNAATRTQALVRPPASMVSIPLATRVAPDAIETLREQFLAETPFQIRYFACHERGWTDSYLLTLDGVPVG